MSGIDPSLVNTPAELAKSLNELRNSRGLSYEEMDKAARKLQSDPGRRWEALGKSTVGEIVTGRRLPSKGKLQTFLVVCHVSSADLVLWLAAWERARRTDAAKPAGALRVREARPRRMGVQAAIRVEGATGEMPDYVPRDIDERLRAALATSAEHGGFVLLVGGASAGKTRALYEAVLATLPDWWLVQPEDARAVRDLAGTAVSHTVIWLDELLRYLRPPEILTAGAVDTLLRAGLVVVGTMWQDDYGIRVAQREKSADDPYAAERDLLRLAEVFDVPDDFTDAELERTRGLAVGDARLRAALESADAGVTQVLAAGPDMVRWWELAPNPYAKAIITAAVDARRLGVNDPVTEVFLADAAPGYVTPTQRAVAPPDWLKGALEYATTPLRGAARALGPVADETMGQVAGYLAADYLLQQARRTRRTACPPTTAWRALHRHCCHGPEDLERLGRAAALRMRYRDAEPFYRSLAADGDWTPTVKLAELLAKDGRYHQAIALIQPRSDSWLMAKNLVDWLAKAGRLDELRARAAAGEWVAARRLADVLVAHGQLDEAIETVRPFAHKENWTTEGALVDLLMLRGDADELRTRANAGSRPATGRLSNLLAKQGHLGEAIEILRPYIDTEPGIAERVVELLLEQGNLDEAVTLLRRFGDAGSGTAVEQLVDLLIDYDHHDEAIEYLRTRATAGNWNARSRLPQYGPPKELHARATAGDRHALNLWVDLLIERDRLDDAVDTFRSVMATANSPSMWRIPKDLVELLFVHQRIEDLRVEVDAGTEGAADRLTELLADGNQRGMYGMPPPRRHRSSYRGWIIMPPH